MTRIINKFEKVYKNKKSEPNKQLMKEPDTLVTHRESENERANEKLQQDSINKQIEDMKKDREDVRAYLADETIKKKLEKMLKQLPQEDRLRNLLDEDREEVNNNNEYSLLKLQE